MGTSRLGLALARWLLISCALNMSCANEHSLDGRASATAGSGQTCPPGLDCDRTCFENTDCNTLSGETCELSDTKTADGRLGPPQPTDSRMIIADAAQRLDPDSDAGPTPPQPAPGYCTTYCATAACPYGWVCSKTGACKPGCDHTRPRGCADNEVCDFDRRECVAEDGACLSDADCPTFDAELMERGSRSCESGRCRFRPSLGFDPGGGSLFHTRTVDDPSLPVLRPRAGERISDLQAFTFEFDVPAHVMVASILTRPHFKNLADAGDAAIWIAYVDGGDALGGVRLADGGAMIGGKWYPQPPAIPLETPLYFFALAYEEGRLVAQSELVPFIVGQSLPRPGDDCPELVNGDFCSAISALVCVDKVCRTPCLSDADCADEGLSCFAPGTFAGVEARVCR